MTPVAAACTKAFSGPSPATSSAMRVGGDVAEHGIGSAPSPGSSDAVPRPACRRACSRSPRASRRATRSEARSPCRYPATTPVTRTERPRRSFRLERVVTVPRGRSDDGDGHDPLGRPIGGLFLAVPADGMVLRGSARYPRAELVCEVGVRAVEERMCRASARPWPRKPTPVSNESCPGASVRLRTPLSRRPPRTSRRCRRRAYELGMVGRDVFSTFATSRPRSALRRGRIRS